MLVNFLMLLLARAEDYTVLVFSSNSNPSSLSLSFTFDRLQDVFAQSYSVEFWIRPSLLTPMTVFTEERDWAFKWSANTLTLENKDTGQIYCTFSNVNSDQWNHISISVPSSNPRFFTCYKNASLDNVEITQNEPAVTSNPKEVLLDSSFRGSIADLRYWTEVLSLEFTQKYYNRYFDSPYPDDLERYWRMINPSDQSVIDDLLGNFDVDVSSFSNLWVTETAEAFICRTNQFFDSNECQDCNSVCLECTSSLLTDCSATSLFYLDTSTQADLTFPANSGAKSIEFYMMPTQWSFVDQPIMHFDPILKLQRKSNTDSVAFIDSQDSEKLALSSVLLNEWTHIAVVWENEIGSVFENGVLVYSDSWEEEDLLNVYIGTSSDLTLSFEGFISELRIWSSAITQENIVGNLRNRLETPYDSSLLHYWKLDEEDSSTIFDSVDSSLFIFSALLRDMWRSLDCTIEECLVFCEDGQFVNENSECENCDSSCKTCSGTSNTDCLICADDFPFTIENSSICLDSCPLGYFVLDNLCLLTCPENTYTETGQTVCLKCDPSCKTCDGSGINDCLECENVIFNGRCEDSCPENTYQAGSECFECDATCQSCTGSSDSQCIACAAGFYKTRDTNLCFEVCPEGYLTIELDKECAQSCPSSYYQSGNECFACSEECGECETFLDICTSCKGDLQLYNNSCVEDCPSKYVGINNVCQPCDDSCAECSGLTSADCTSCSPSFFLFFSDQTCRAECSGFILEGVCYLACPENYYNSESTTCLPCKSNCQTCENNTECLSCPSSTFLYEQDCIGTCPERFYENTETNECSECSNLCAECTGSTINDCSRCLDGLFLYSNEEGTQCLEDCTDDSYPVGSDCINCSNVNCSRCESSSECSLCLESFYLSSSIPGKCVDGCELGEISYNSQTECVPISSKFPEGIVDIREMTRIQLDFPIALSKGTGTVQVFNSDGSELITISTLNTGVFVFNSTFSASVSSSVFESNASYRIEISEGAVLAADSSPMLAFSWEFTIEPYTLQPLVAIINKGIRAIEIQQNYNFTLNSSMSYDPSSTRANGELSFIWNCENFTADYANYIANKGTSWANYVQSIDLADSSGECADWAIPASQIFNYTNERSVNSVVRIKFTLLDTTGRVSDTDIFIRTISADSLALQFQDTPIFKVNTDKPFWLRSSGDFEPDFLTWSVTPDDALIITPLIGTQYLSVAEGGLAPGTAYTFSLTYVDFQTRSSTVVSITTNEPPANSVLYLEPSSGDALDTIIRGQVFSCTDEDLPLSYSFAYAFGEYDPESQDPNEYPLTGRQTDPFFIAYFPRGSITVLGYCYDSLGASSYSKATVDLSEQNDLSSINNAANLILYELTADSVVANVASAAAVAFELHFANIESEEIKSRLISSVEDALSFADTLSSSFSVLQSYIYYSSLIALEPISKSPITDSQKSEVLEIISSLDTSKLFAYERVEFIESDITGESTQSSLSTKDLFNLSSKIYEIVINLSSSQFINEIGELVRQADRVLNLNAQPTEQPRQFQTSTASVYHQLDYSDSFANSTVEVDSSHYLFLSSVSESRIEVNLQASVIKANTFNGTNIALDEYFSVTLTDLTNSSDIEDLPAPILFEYRVPKADIVAVQQKISQDQGESSSIWPQCVFWDVQEWSTDGCTLENVSEIYNFFELAESTSLSDSVVFRCSCVHLSDFSIAFEVTNNENLSSFIIASKSVRLFDDWEVSIVFYFLLCNLLLFFAGMVGGYIWDNRNPGVKNPSIMTDKHYGFCDPSKVRHVLGLLEKEHLSVGESTPESFLARFMNSAFYAKIAKGQPKRPVKTPKTSVPEHPVERVMSWVKDGSQSVFQEPHILEPQGSILPENNPMLIRTAAYLNLGDRTLYQDEEDPLVPLSMHMSGISRSQVDQFLAHYDNYPVLRRRFGKRKMTQNDLKSLGFSPYEFEGLVIAKDNKVEPDPYQLTEGRYIDKVIKNVNSFQNNVELKYWSLVLIYIRKEHKILSLFFNLHIEFTKKQMMCYLLIYNLFQLILCQIYIRYIDWDFSEIEDGNNRCSWGCTHEAQVLAGMGIACLCWPILFFTKNLFANNLVKITAEPSYIQQAAFNKHCKEIIGILWVIVGGAFITILSIMLAVYEPFNEDQALHFVYCYCASLFWSLFLGEIFGALFKAYCVWMAQGKRDNNDSCTANFFYWLLTYLPCVIIT